MSHFFEKASFKSYAVICAPCCSLAILLYVWHTSLIHQDHVSALGIGRPAASTVGHLYVLHVHMYTYMTHSACKRHYICRAHVQLKFSLYNLTSPTPAGLKHPVFCLPPPGLLLLPPARYSCCCSPLLTSLLAVVQNVNHTFVYLPALHGC